MLFPKEYYGDNYREAYVSEFQYRLLDGIHPPLLPYYV